MGLGVGKSRFETEAAEVAAAKAKQAELERKAAQLRRELESSALLELLTGIIEETMYRVYKESDEGKAQMHLITNLKVNLDAELMAKNLTRKIMARLHAV
jgi:hypothetical protein